MNHRHAHRLLGIVLCGGQSTRMGRDKAMLRHPEGGTYWSFAVNRLQPLCEEVCLSGRTSATTEVRQLFDAVPGAGPAGGVAAALQFAASQSLDAVLVTPVDMPLLTTDDLQLMCDRWKDHPTQLIVAVSGARQHIEPLVAIYPVQFESEVVELAGGDDRSLARWVASQNYRTVELRSSACRNVNTPEDLNRGPEVSI